MLFIREKVRGKTGLKNVDPSPRPSVTTTITNYYSRRTTALVGLRKVPKCRRQCRLSTRCRNLKNETDKAVGRKTTRARRPCTGGRAWSGRTSEEVSTATGPFTCLVHSGNVLNLGAVERAQYLGEGFVVRAQAVHGVVQFFGVKLVVGQH